MYWKFCKDDQQDKWMYKPVFRIRNILERIQIRGTEPRTYGSGTCSFRQ
jgi:hypothetical protein